MIQEKGHLRTGRTLLALALTLAISLVLVEVTVTLPAPGAAAAELGYSFITFGSWNDVSPAWSPDGVTLAFASASGGFYHIFIIDTTGVIHPLPLGSRDG